MVGRHPLSVWRILGSADHRQELPFPFQQLDGAMLSRVIDPSGVHDTVEFGFAERDTNILIEVIEVCRGNMKQISDSMGEAFQVRRLQPFADPLFKHDGKR